MTQFKFLFLFIFFFSHTLVASSIKYQCSKNGVLSGFNFTNEDIEKLQNQPTEPQLENALQSVCDDFTECFAQHEIVAALTKNTAKILENLKQELNNKLVEFKKIFCMVNNGLY